MRVLVVEDDCALGAFLNSSLLREGYSVRCVMDGETALRELELFCPDLVLLDLSLPKLDGEDVLAELRTNYAHVSVLVVTGRSGGSQRIRCLDLGADDCLLKPFSVCELMARSRALLRRREQLSPSTVRLGNLEMNRIERRVEWDGTNIELTGREFAVLEYLMGRPGECVSREELLKQVWQMSIPSTTNVVDVYINYVRRKLSNVAQHHGVRHIIETVRGSGYRIVTSRAEMRQLAPAVSPI